MAATKFAYQVWDDESGNIIAKYGTQDEAVGFLHALFNANGPSAVVDLSIIEYPADGSPPLTVLEGAELVAQRQVPA
jgi:hypothetical protein